MFGLPDPTIKLIRDYFASCPEIKSVKIYGSRAMNTEKEGSDIDFAIYSSAPSDISGRVQADLDALSTPYLFDVTDYYKITHVPLREHIDRVGKDFYVRGS